MEMIDYTPMFQYMEKHGITQYYLLNHGISNRVLDAVKHGRNITMLTAEKLCEVLECKIEDIVEFK